jgi:hypothetical protein
MVVATPLPASIAIGAVEGTETMDGTETMETVDGMEGTSLLVATELEGSEGVLEAILSVLLETTLSPPLPPADAPLRSSLSVRRLERLDGARDQVDNEHEVQSFHPVWIVLKRSDVSGLVF